MTFVILMGLLAVFWKQGFFGQLNNLKVFMEGSILWIWIIYINNKNDMYTVYM
jgi:hypothetical protein